MGVIHFSIGVAAKSRRKVKKIIKFLRKQEDIEYAEAYSQPIKKVKDIDFSVDQVRYDRIKSNLLSRSYDEKDAATWALEDSINNFQPFVIFSKEDMRSQGILDFVSIPQRHYDREEYIMFFLNEFVNGHEYQDLYYCNVKCEVAAKTDPIEDDLTRD